MGEELSAEDQVVLRQWIAVVQATPSVVKAVLGGIQLNFQRVIVEFFGSRLGVPSDALEPTMLAAAAQGIIQAARTLWFFHGGDLASIVSESLEILERGFAMNPTAGLDESAPWTTGGAVRGQE
jgi:hypothetical protein